jgi:hypothetical protein
MESIPEGTKISSPYPPRVTTLANVVAAFTMKVARPLIWHNVRESWPKRLLGGTCFILRFDAGLIGVTAEHVIKGFEKDAKKPGVKIVCMLRTVPFDLIDAIVDRDAELDIATFSVTEDQLTRSEAVAIDCRAEWPPPEPGMGTALSLAGFPEELKKASSSVEFRAYVSQLFVEDVTEREIIATYEPQRDTRVRAAPEFPDLGANLSGCSGGPALMHVEHNGLLRCFPVGIIVASVPGSAAAGFGFDIIRIRRIDVIREDGTINRPSNDWLPGPSGDSKELSGGVRKLWTRWSIAMRPAKAVR